MAVIGRTTVTRGALIKLRADLEFIQNGTEILKIKRDRLARELNELFAKLARREELEKRLMEIYADFKRALVILGYETVSSVGLSVSKAKINLLPLSIMGVSVPKVVFEGKPRIDVIQEMSLYAVAEKLQILIEELLMLAEIEAKTERISYELMNLNRKVNALEKVIVPKYVHLIRHMEDSLFDEDLEDLNRIRHIRDILEKRKP